MDSRFLERAVQDYSTSVELVWRPLGREVVRQAPTGKGVYFFRARGGSVFGRLKEKSDLVYIGKAQGQGGIRQRIRGHIYGGVDQKTNERSKWLQERLPMEVAWAVVPDPSFAEQELLDFYFQDHWELPPLNRAGSGFM